MKPPKLLRHLGTKHFTLKNKLHVIEHFERKLQQQAGLQRLLKAATSVNMAALIAPYLVADRIAKAKKPFTIGEELIQPAAINICSEMLGETAANKIGHDLLLAGAVTRRVEDIAEILKCSGCKGLTSRRSIRCRLMSQPTLKTRLLVWFTCDTSLEMMFMTMCGAPFNQYNWD